jgi:hypothetical protein
MPVVNTKAVVSLNVKDGDYLVFPYRQQIAETKAKKACLYVYFVITAALDPANASFVGRRFKEYIDITSDRGAMKLTYLAQTFGHDEVIGDSTDPEFIKEIFGSEDDKIAYEIFAAIKTTSSEGADGRTFTNTGLDTSKKTGLPMIAKISEAQSALQLDPAAFDLLIEKAKAEDAKAEESYRRKDSGGGNSAPKGQGKPKSDDGYSSGGYDAGSTPYTGGDEDIPF